jgi:hypothetical protein
MAQRILGQNTVVSIIVNSAPQTEINSVRSFSFNYELELKDEGYLGESTNRKDSVFKGIKFDMEMHLANNAAFQLIKTAIDKAQRRTPGVRINVKTSLTWPNGDRAVVVFNDVEFGPFPVNTNSRTDYVTLKIEGACSEAVAILT